MPHPIPYLGFDGTCAEAMRFYERALDGRTVRAILVTHCHSDHSPLSAWLHELTGAPRIAYGPHTMNLDWVDDDEPEEPSEEERAEVAAAMVRWAQPCRRAQRQGDLSVLVSTRTLLS